MNKPQLLALYDQDQRIDIVYPGIRREVFPGLVRHTNISGYGEGLVIYSRLDEKMVDEVIHAQIEYFKSIGQNFEWKVYSHDRPLDLRERLAARGFEVEDAEAIMVLDLAEAPARLLQPVSHTIKKITDPGGIEDVVMIESMVWGVDFSDMGQYLADSLDTHPEQLSIYIACIDENPASAAWIYFAQGSQFASLWGGSTLEPHRSQGLYTALLAVRVQEAMRRRLTFLTVDASPMSRPILEKFGFQKIADAYACKWSTS